MCFQAVRGSKWVIEGVPEKPAERTHLREPYKVSDLRLRRLRRILVRTSATPAYTSVRRQTINGFHSWPKHAKAGQALGFDQHLTPFPDIIEQIRQLLPGLAHACYSHAEIESHVAQAIQLAISRIRSDDRQAFDSCLRTVDS